MTTGTVKRTATSKWLSTSMLGGGALLCLLGAPVAAHADDLPAGGSVTAGAATIASNGQTTTVNQTTSRAVINWDSFSVGHDKTVDFVQPDASSATLNRVTGNTTSTIAGLIRSNGAVYLINPNGIAITATGSVQTGGGFVASTLNMADNDFMGGKIRFAGSGSSAGVSNAGHITAGQGAYVALLGGSVSNSGTIAVPLGRVGLGSGESVTLDLNGDGFMQVAVPTSALTGDRALIEHSGTISASGGLVMLTAATVKDAVRNVINLSGGISADSATGSGGRIILSGGDGGTVNATGTLSARATGAAGNGGLVETSGANVNFAGLRVDTSAAHGVTGTWLIDPTDLNVDAAAASTISANLATSNVMLKTNADGTTSGPGNTSAGNGDININAAIGWTSGNALTLSAYHDININAAIKGGNASTITVRADNSGTDSGSVYFSGAGAIGSQAGGTVGHVDIFYNTSNYFLTNNYASRVSAPFTAYMLVNNAHGLQNINQNLAGTYALGRDIDASDTVNWNSGLGFSSLGSESNPFTGTLIGAATGSSITGLTINAQLTTSVGLFSAIGATGQVSDIHLVGGSVSTKAGLNSSNVNIGALAGINLGTIARSSASTNVSGQAVWANQSSVGGLIGSNGGVITASSASGTVVNSGGFYNVGGFAGSNYGTIFGSFATGTVTGITDFGYVGGLVGTNSGFVNQSYASGDVHGAFLDAIAGGLVGKNYSGGLLADTYATGAIYADQSASQSGSVQLGGLVGANYSTIMRSFATGHVGVGGSGANSTGGLVGSASGGSVSYSFWDMGTTGQTSGGTSGAIGLSTAQMQDFSSYAATYTTFDFNSIWAPPAQAGQAGQTVGYYPQLFATTPIVVLVTAATKVYGAPLSSIVTNPLGGPSTYAFGPTGDSLPAPAITGVGAGANVGSYAINYAAGNSIVSLMGVTYRVINGNRAGILTITPAQLFITYTSNPGTRAYGAPDPTYTGTYSATGLVNGDTLAAVIKGTAFYGTPAGAASNVGIYAINGGGLSGNTANYNFFFLQATSNATALSITPASLSVSANPLTRSYGAANPALTYATVGLVNGDTLSGALATTATSSSNVGSYAITQGTLAASSNYVLTFTGASLIINPAALTVTYTANPVSRFYGAANPAFTGTQSATGLVNGDTLAGVTSGTAVYGSTATTTSNVGSYAVTGSGLSGNSGNYNFTFVQAAGNATALSVTPASATITYTADPFSRLYGAANPAFIGTQSATGLVNGDTLTGVTSGSAVYGTTATSGSNVGSYAINGSGLSGNNANYAFTFVQAAGNATALSVTPASATITYTADPFSRLYGASNPAFTGTQSATGLVNGDTLGGVTAGTAIYSSAANGGSNVGSYAINGSGLSASTGNYNLTFVQAAGNATALSITPASLSVIADPLSRAYGAANPALTYTSTGLVNGDTLSGALATTATSGSNVGSYAITQGNLAASSNYVLTFTGASLIINPAALTVTYTADPISRLYGAANPTFTGTQSATGLVNGDTLTGVTSGTAVYGTTATSGSNVGSYAIDGSGLSGNSGNYIFTFAQAAGNATALSVTPASVTITYTANPFSRLYGAANPAFTGTQSANGLVNGDTLTGVTAGTASYGSAANASSNVGSYAITGSGLSGNSGNYTFSFVQAAGNATALSITPASLSVTANPLSRTYGAANPALTYSTTGLVNGDTLSGALATSATSNSNVGSYAITQGNLAASSNYTLTFTGASLIINPAALTVTYAASPLSRIYGNANPAFSGTQSAAGLVNGDTLAGVTNGTAVYGSTAGVTSNVGSYAITGSGLTANSGNYSFTFVQAAGNATALSVTPRALSVTANPISRQFGAPNPPLTYVVGATTATSGLVNGDVLTGALSTTATQTSPSGDYLILQGTLAASSNYTFTYTGAVLKIALPPLQSLSSFIARPSDLNVTLATEQSQGCTDAEVSESMRETGSAKLGDGSGNTSCK